MDEKFCVKYDRPIHRENPGLQTDHCHLDLPEADSIEAALAKINEWKDWFIANGYSNIRLYKINSDCTIEVPIFF